MTIGYVPEKVLQTNDGGYLICGSRHTDITNTDAFLLKVDASGAVEWAKSYLDCESVDGIVQMSDGGYYFVTRYLLGLTGAYDLMFVRTDSVGNMLWSKARGSGNQSGSHVYTPNAMVDLGNGDYMVGGTTNAFNGIFHAMLMKVDANGSSTFWKAYEIGTKSEIKDLALLPNGNVAFTGYTKGGGALQEDLLIGEISSLGIYQWSRRIGDSLEDVGHSIKVGGDGSLYVAGETELSAGSFSNLYCKFDSAGNEIWSRRFGTSTVGAHDLEIKSNGEIYVIGTVGDTSTKNAVALLKINSNGGMMSADTFSVGGGRVAYDAVITSDGGLAISSKILMDLSIFPMGYPCLVKTIPAGVTGCSNSAMGTPNISINWADTTTGSASLNGGQPTNSTTAMRVDTFVDSTLCLTTPIESRKTTKLKVYPNPASDKIVLESNKQFTAARIVDLYGRTCYSNTNPTSNLLEIDVSQLASALYLLYIESDVGTSTRKILIRHDDD